MKNETIILTFQSIVILLLLNTFTINALGQDELVFENIKYYGPDHFLLEGTTIPDNLKKNGYQRLPESAKKNVRPHVWYISKTSAGLSIRFKTNSPVIKAKWEVLRDEHLSHMAGTGVRGIDMYCRVNDQWQYVNTGKPKDKINEALLVYDLPVEEREFKINLPLYDGIKYIEIGIDSTYYINAPQKNKKKPIVFYGTSITQGGCASRPGMAFTNIISRELDVDCINYGFGGNGKMEKGVAEVIANIDASFYVIDCIGNMTPEEIHQNMVPLVAILRSKKPEIPIVFVGSIIHDRTRFDPQYKKLIEQRNEAMREELDRLKKMVLPDIYHISCEGALGTDHEATVDGVHLTDLGFKRFADHLLIEFKRLQLY